MKLIITRGLPASGKTTLAREWVAEDPARRGRVNRDDLRAMVNDRTFIKGATEQLIIGCRDAAISALLREGVDVICDDTNLPSRTVRDLRKLAKKAGAEFEVVDLTDVDVATCIERDAQRERTVGEDVIRDQHMRFVNGKPHPLPVADDPPDATGMDVYEPDPDLPSAVLVDVDGTVAIMCGRSPYDETRVHEDRPNLPVIRAVQAMDMAGYELVFMSARTAACREATDAWIKRHVGDFAELHMRAEGDMRKDSVVKAELFDRHIRGRWNIVGVFDDRRQVVDMWRAAGLTVFHVAEGEF